MKTYPNTPSNKTWRKLLALDLASFNLALFFFAYLPPNTLNYVEMFIMACSVLCFIGLVSHASTRVSLPLENWSYLLTGAIGLATIILYVKFQSDAEYYFKVTYILFLLSGTISAYAAHIIDGGGEK